MPHLIDSNLTVQGARAGASEPRRVAAVASGDEGLFDSSEANDGRWPELLAAIEAGEREAPFPDVVHAVARNESSEPGVYAPTRTIGQVAHIAEIARDIIEVLIVPSEPMQLRPGQYCEFVFRGHPARPFSPTSALGRIAEDGKLRLNVRRMRNGRVTAHLGKSIEVGHDVEIEGPFGHSFLTPYRTERLVLVGCETGFAPIWAIAAAALRERTDREIVLIAASRQLDAFYMAPALTLASCYPRVSIVAAVEELAQPWLGLLPGRPLDLLPSLAPTDIVHAAGSPAMVSELGNAAAAVGATFYADVFEPARPTRSGWIESARGWLKTG